MNGIKPAEILRFWFSLSAPVQRKPYLWSGLLLMGIRILYECLIIAAFAGFENARQLSPLHFVNPTFSGRYSLLSDMFSSMGIEMLAIALITALALPMMWIGLSMSLRRARNGGISQWWGLLFLFPGINYLAIAALCILPDREDINQPEPDADSPEGLALAAVKASLYATVFAVGFTAVSVFILGDYGKALFVATPMMMGTIAGWRINRPVFRSVTQGMSAAFVATLVSGGAMILLALEGIVCLSMVFPLVILLSLTGGAFGSALARAQALGSKSITTMALVIPIVGTTDAQWPEPLHLYENTSEIHIDAPPDAVWEHVVSFSELPPPSDWLLQTGIACPLRARIEGEGVGAVRYCEFTTGPFVEPITVWDPPHTLGFNVVEQPEPMHEWSPYDEVFSPHLKDTMMSQRGQFELIETDQGTLLRGTTWYTLDLAPAPYWRLWSDFVVHRIHMRVLKHIKRLSEA